MKVANVDIQFHSRGSQGKINYKVESNAKMMKLLSDSLYSDKIKACIRELSTNAFDAHVMAGKQDVPFDVQLPDSNNGFMFKIRDYGVGMSPEQVENMYQTYGNSTKTDSNEQQGCMGLGSKSPFCYVEVFTSVSYFNGKQYTWVNSKDELGIPSLNRMSVKDTNEPNGFSVSFLCEKSDDDEFKSTAEEVYRPFPINPNFVNGPQADIKEDEVYLKGKDGDWIIVNRKTRDRRYYYRKPSKVVMGYVEYPIDADQLQDHSDDNKKGYRSSRDNKYTTMLRSASIVLNMDIGEVEMDISREGLQYTKATIAALKYRLDKCIDEIAEEVSEKFEACENKWAARRLYSELVRGELEDLKELIRLGRVSYEGENISSPVDLYHQDYSGADMVVMKGSRDSISTSSTEPNLIRVSTLRTEHYISAKNNLYIKGESIPETSDESANREFYIFENDMSKGGHAAMKREIQSKEIKHVVLLKFENASARTNFFKQSGIPESWVHKTSEIVKVVKKTTKRGDKTKAVAYKLLHEGRTVETLRYGRRRLTRDSARVLWQEGEIEIAKGGVFIEIKAWMMENVQRISHPTELIVLLTKMKRAGITVPNIWGIKSNGVEKFKKHTAWMTFDEWAVKAIRSYVKSNNLQESVEAVALWKSWLQSQSGDTYRIYELVNPKSHTILTGKTFKSHDDKKNEKLTGSISPTSKLRLQAERIAVSEKTFEIHKGKVEALTSMLDRYPQFSSGLNREGEFDDSELIKGNEEVRKTYPMLTLLDTYDVRRHENGRQLVLDYINSIDRSN